MAGKRFSADAVRFLAESAPAGEIAYILTDHLGTPQKLIDGNRNLAWERVQTPFGLTHFETAAPVRATNVRFPGQHADGESGLSYNYFRDYDPTTGRYVQSDPIGLAGGLNTYGYVGGNPVMYYDPLGLLNRVKAGVGVINVLRAVKQGLEAKMLATVAAIASSLRQPQIAVPAAALAGAKAFAARSSAKRGGKQFGEALTESECEESYRNLLGLAPFGDKFDDPKELLPWEMNIFMGSSLIDIIGELSTVLP